MSEEILADSRHERLQLSRIVHRSEMINRVRRETGAILIVGSRHRDGDAGDKCIGMDRFAWVVGRQQKTRSAVLDRFKCGYDRASNCRTSTRFVN